MGNMHTICQELMEKAKMKIKYSSLIVNKGSFVYYYVCNTVVWNWYLDRYYPKAELILSVEKLNTPNSYKIHAI